MALRKKHPEWDRPTKMPGGTATGIVGAIISFGIIVSVAFGMPGRAWVMFGIWIIIGIGVYQWAAYKRRVDPSFSEAVLTPADIPAESIE